MLLRLYLEQGVGKTELARRFGISRRTNYHWVETGELDRDLESNRAQQSRGATWIYVPHHLQSAIHYMRRRELGFMEWWRSLRGRKAYAFFSWTVPLPCLSDRRKSINALWSKKRRNPTSVPAVAAVSAAETGAGTDSSSPAVEPR